MKKEWRLSTPSGELRLVRWWDVAPAESHLAVDAALLDLWDVERSHLVDICQDWMGAVDFSRVSTDSLRETLRGALADGRVVALRVPRRPRVRALASLPGARTSPSAEPAPLAEARPAHWIEIQMLGEDDRPIAGEEYEIVLPSGEVVRGRLDRNGLARIEGISTPGACQVSFPRLDRDAWSPIAAGS